MPTRTEQADLDLAISAGHGEFARVVYAPGTVGEAFELTVKAFDVAERFQIPAISRIVLSPGVFAAGCFHLKTSGTKVRIVENCNIHGYWKTDTTI